jgi:16S rRNA (cytosine967-C5)-methyltransferase
MKNRGSILACDCEARRVELLQQNAKRLRAEIVRTTRHDWRDARIPPEIEAAGPFDRILIDAPCTNTGVMRRRIDVRWRLHPDEFARMQLQQLEICRGVAPLLKPGGVLVYSTCSLEAEENEWVTERLTAELRGARVLEKKSLVPFRDNCDGAFAAKLTTHSN